MEQITVNMVRILKCKRLLSIAASFRLFFHSSYTLKNGVYFYFTSLFFFLLFFCKFCIRLIFLFFIHVPPTSCQSVNNNSYAHLPSLNAWRQISLNFIFCWMTLSESLCPSRHVASTSLYTQRPISFLLPHSSDPGLLHSPGNRYARLSTLWEEERSRTFDNVLKLSPDIIIHDISVMELHVSALARGKDESHHCCTHFVLPWNLWSPTLPLLLHRWQYYFARTTHRASRHKDWEWIFRDKWLGVWVDEWKRIGLGWEKGMVWCVSIFLFRVFGISHIYESSSKYPWLFPENTKMGEKTKKTEKQRTIWKEIIKENDADWGEINNNETD